MSDTTQATARGGLFTRAVKSVSDWWNDTEPATEGENRTLMQVCKVITKRMARGTARALHLAKSFIGFAIGWEIASVAMSEAITWTVGAATRTAPWMLETSLWQIVPQMVTRFATPIVSWLAGTFPALAALTIGGVLVLNPWTVAAVIIGAAALTVALLMRRDVIAGLSQYTYYAAMGATAVLTGVRTVFKYTFLGLLNAVAWSAAGVAYTLFTVQWAIRWAGGLTNESLAEAIAAQREKAGRSNVVPIRGKGHATPKQIKSGRAFIGPVLPAGA